LSFTFVVNLLQDEIIGYFIAFIVLGFTPLVSVSYNDPKKRAIWGSYSI